MQHFKTYIIRMQGQKVSEELSSDLALSLEQMSISYNYFDAIYGTDVEKYWQEYKLFFYHKQSENKKTNGVKGCFLSHYTLWNNCIEDNIPYLIFEHDALMIRNLPNQIFDEDFDVLNLDYASRKEKDYEMHLSMDKGYKIMPWSADCSPKGFYSRVNKLSIKGLHAYIIKPNGAKKLIKKANELGTLPADIHVNSLYVNLKYTKTSYARINPKYWIDSKTGSVNSFTRI